MKKTQKIEKVNFKKIKFVTKIIVENHQLHNFHYHRTVLNQYHVQNRLIKNTKIKSSI